MLEINKLVDLIEASQAVYGSLTTTPSLKSVLTSDSDHGGADFTEKEANAFVERYEIAAPLESKPSGFQAILFKDKIDNKYVFAIRGSEQLAQDFIYADVGDIGEYGYAAAQAVDMYRYWKKLTTSALAAVDYTQTEITQLYLLTHPLLGTSNIVASAADYIALVNSLKTDVGIGAISSTQKVEVTGHSLGGNLANVFASMFPANIDQVVTINAPSLNGGLGNIQGYGVTAQDLLALMGFSQVDQSKITSVTSEGDLVHLTSGSQIGSVVNISQEVGHQPIDGLSNNHSVINGLDSLNLMGLFSTLDPSQKNHPGGILSDFMRASSNQTIDTFENMLDGLRKILLGDSYTTKIAAGSKNDIEARNELYNNIDELRDRIINGDLNYLVGNVNFIKSSADVSSAKQSYDQFLSLYYLTPFVLSGKDSDLKFFDLGLYQAWYSDKSLSAADRNNGKANFSDRWYEDRASMLRAQISRNTYDTESDTHTNNNPYTIYFHDEASNTDVKSEANIHPAYENSDISFGDDLNNSLTGTFFNDRLYGGLGNDTLKGMEGHDYIEGGGGDDLIYGGDGSDQLYGNTGDDQLVGEGGNDILMGGQGNDTYIFTGQFGRDIIKDSDGNGSIVINGATLSQLTQSAKDSIVYYDNIDNPTKKAIVIDEGNTKSLIISTVTKSGNKIIDSGNSVTIKNWSDGSLGINLNDAQTPVNVITNTLNGDNNSNALYAASKSPYQDLTYAPPITIDGGDGDDFIEGSWGGDNLYGGKGNDWIDAGSTYYYNALYPPTATDPTFENQGHDFIDGGEGDDVITGRSSDSVWHGGKGRDMLLANTVMTFGVMNMKEGDNFSKQYMPELNNTQAGRELAVDYKWRDLLHYAEADYKIYANKNGGITTYSYSAWAGFTPGTYQGNSSAGSAWTYNFNFQGTPLHLPSETNGAGVVTYNYQPVLGNITLNYSNASKNPAVVNADWKTYLMTFAIPNDEMDLLVNGDTYITLFGDEGDDLLVGWEGKDELYGGADNDALWGGAGDDLLDGGDGNDTLAGEAGSDTIIGGKGNDVVVGDVDDTQGDVIYGGEGNDTLTNVNLSVFLMTNNSPDTSSSFFMPKAA